MKNLKNALNKQRIELIGSLFLLAIFVLPFLTFAANRKDIYVDGSKNGTETGSISKPYHTISEALKNANERTDVHVAKGTYEDNIEIPKGVRVFGSETDEVIIRSKSSRKVVVSMKDNTKINKLTIEKGNEGVWIKDDATVSIVECVIRDNEKDGIRIGNGSTKNKDAVNISESTITNNGRAGVFSQKRRIVLMDNEISGNDSDGVDLAAGTSAWIENNNFKDNNGSGMKLKLDGSNIWTKKNTFRDNDHSGLEINAYGAAGRIDINKAKFLKNKQFGVSRIAHGSINASTWSGLTVQANSTYQMTKLGEVSPISKAN